MAILIYLLMLTGLWIIVSVWASLYIKEVNRQSKRWDDIRRATSAIQKSTEKIRLFTPALRQQK